MLKKFGKIILFFAFSLLITGPTTAFAWHDYTYQDWDWHGSGRDHPYSYYVDNYYNNGYAGFSFSEFDEDSYVSYINNVTPPPIVPLSPGVMQQVPVLPPPESEFTVNIPNNHGGYTPVLIKRSGNGFVGPQGEYYPDFPKVSQLKLMYG